MGRKENDCSSYNKSRNTSVHVYSSNEVDMTTIVNTGSQIKNLFLINTIQL